MNRKELFSHRRWEQMNIARNQYGNGGYAEDYDEGFKTGYDFMLPIVLKLAEALDKNKSEWEAVNPNGHKHMVAWQMTRDALNGLDTLLKEAK